MLGIVSLVFPVFRWTVPLSISILFGSANDIWTRLTSLSQVGWYKLSIVRTDLLFFHTLAHDDPSRIRQYSSGGSFNVALAWKITTSGRTLGSDPPDTAQARFTTVGMDVSDAALLDGYILFVSPRISYGPSADR
jgi:hypothetical protein